MDEETVHYPKHMQPDREYCFRITIIEASDISEQYSDVFCQFKLVFFMIKQLNLILTIFNSLSFHLLDFRSKNFMTLNIF